MRSKLAFPKKKKSAKTPPLGKSASDKELDSETAVGSPKGKLDDVPRTAITPATKAQGSKHPKAAPKHVERAKIAESICHLLRGLKHLSQIALNFIVETLYLRIAVLATSCFRTPTNYSSASFECAASLFQRSKIGQQVDGCHQRMLMKLSSSFRLLFLSTLQTNDL